MRKGTHMIVFVKHDKHCPDRQKPIGVHGTNVITNEFVICDSHDNYNKEIQAKHHLQKAEYGVVLLCTKKCQVS